MLHASQSSRRRHSAVNEEGESKGVPAQAVEEELLGLWECELLWESRKREREPETGTSRTKNEKNPTPLMFYWKSRSNHGLDGLTESASPTGFDRFFPIRCFKRFYAISGLLLQPVSGSTGPVFLTMGWSRLIQLYLSSLRRCVLELPLLQLIRLIILPLDLFMLI